MRSKWTFIAIASLVNTLMVTGVNFFDRWRAATPSVHWHQTHPEMFAGMIFVLSFVVIAVLAGFELVLKGVLKKY